MDVYHFKKDLETYSPQDIMILTRFFKIRESNYDNILWLLAMKLKKHKQNPDSKYKTIWRPKTSKKDEDTLELQGQSMLLTEDSPDTYVPRITPMNESELNDFDEYIASL